MFLAIREPGRAIRWAASRSAGCVDVVIKSRVRARLVLFIVLRNFIQTNYDAASAPSPHRRPAPEAQVVAGGAIADHADVKRLEDAKDLLPTPQAFDSSLPIRATSARFSTSARHSEELGQQRLGQQGIARRGRAGGVHGQGHAHFGGGDQIN